MAFRRAHLGHGIGLRSKHYGRFLDERPDVGWIEAISENFIDVGGRPLAVLEKVRGDFPLVLHGVSLSIGSVDPLDLRHLAGLRALADRIEPAYVSDHLGWGTHRGGYLHDLMPLPYTEEALTTSRGGCRRCRTSSAARSSWRTCPATPLSAAPPCPSGNSSRR